MSANLPEEATATLAFGQLLNARIERRADDLMGARGNE